MGTGRRGVAPKSKSSIEITFTYKGKRCRESLPLKPTPSNLTKAENFRAAILESIMRGTFDYSITFPNSKKAAEFVTFSGQIKTVEEYFTEWLNTKRPHTSSSTHYGYRKIVNGVIIPSFGNIRLIDLSTRDVKLRFSKMEVSNKRFSNILSVIRSAIEDARQDEIVDKNPFLNWSYRRKGKVKTKEKIDPFTSEEQKRLLAACDGAEKNQLMVFLWTGLRTSELIALTWKDVDFKRRQLRVTKATTTAAKGEAEVPKSNAGYRTVQLLQPAYDALIDQKRMTRMKGLSVFVSPHTGEPWKGDSYIRYEWQKLIKRAGVKYRNPYQTRHTYASMMLSAGEHPMWVADQMGHADWTMIAKVYGKWMPDANIAAGEKAVDAFS